MNSPSYQRTIFIVGNPNVGKTTLFNDLTGANEPVSNYNGSTHAAKSRLVFDNFGKQNLVYDLPGVYGASAYLQEEQQIFKLLYQSNEHNRILLVVNAQQLERNLFLVTQILELGIPTCLVITFSEHAYKQGHALSIAVLQQALKIPIIPLSEAPQLRRRQLRDILTQDQFQTSALDFRYAPNIQRCCDMLEAKSGLSKGWCECFLFQDSQHYAELIADKAPLFLHTIDELNQVDHHWKTRMIAARYSWIEQLVARCIQHIPKGKRHTLIPWDRLFLHNVWGPLAGGVIFFAMLFAVFSLSEYPMRVCEWGIQWLQLWINTHLPHGWLQALISEGIIGGVGNVLLFLPQFVLMVTCMNILENTGYLARITFLLDRLMKKIGLSGSSFIALISCYACTIPGLLQTRCLPNREERLTTLFVAPWVNCASRIPIYLLLLSLLFDDLATWTKVLILISIYLTGLLAALVLAAIIRKYILKSRHFAQINEMPPLLYPQWNYILKVIKAQTWFFLKKSGTVVLGFSIVLWCCLHTNFTLASGKTINCVHWLSDKLELIFKPIGFDGNISISLLSAFGARENFISTLGVLYNVDAKQPGTLRTFLQQAVDAQGNPIYSLATCVSLILFFMFSLQCIGTFISVKHETYSWRKTLLQFVFMNAFTYGLCFTVYHVLA